NKKYLVEIVKKIFEDFDNSSEAHDLIAKMPQIKDIITTNYDSLFENSIKELDVIYKSTDYINSTKNNQKLFKIHGDFTTPNDIVITKSDYINLFSNDFLQTIFWNAITDRIASKNVVFVGYSLEDS